MESAFRPDQTEFTALAQSLGFKIERADISKLTASKVFELKRKITGYKEQISMLRNKYKDGLINQDTFTMKAEEIAEKIKLVAAKYQVKFDKATYADTKEPFEDIKNLFEGKN